MNKRGQGGLSMDTIVVAIIAIIVLLLIVTFFTGGLGTIGQRISDVFQKGTAGYDLDLAVKNCQDYCSRAQQLPTDTLKQASPYCNVGFDTDGDKTDESCKSIGVTCSGVDSLGGCQ